MGVSASLQGVLAAFHAGAPALDPALGWAAFDWSALGWAALGVAGIGLFDRFWADDADDADRRADDEVTIAGDAAGSDPSTDGGDRVRSAAADDADEANGAAGASNGSGAGPSPALSDRVDALEDDVEQLSASVNAVYSENRAMSEAVEDIARDVRRLLAERTTRGGAADGGTAETDATTRGEHDMASDETGDETDFDRLRAEYGPGDGTADDDEGDRPDSGAEGADRSADRDEAADSRDRFVAQAERAADRLERGRVDPDGVAGSDASASRRSDRAADRSDSAPGGRERAGRSNDRTAGRDDPTTDEAGRDTDRGSAAAGRDTERGSAAAGRDTDPGSAATGRDTDPGSTDAGRDERPSAADDDAPDAAATSSGAARRFQFPTGVVDDGAERPYLRALPNGYVTDLLVMEWLDFLVSEGSVTDATRAINYYERIGWIHADVAEQLEDHLTGFGDVDRNRVDEPGCDELAPTHHTRSLKYIMQLSDTTTQSLVVERWDELSGGLDGR